MRKIKEIITAVLINGTGSIKQIAELMGYKRHDNVAVLSIINFKNDYDVLMLKVFSLRLELLTTNFGDYCDVWVKTPHVVNFYSLSKRAYVYSKRTLL